MLTMKDVVSNLETQILSFCHKQNFSPSKQQAVCDMAVEAIRLNHQNYHLRKAIDDHKFFHSMIGLEYEHVRLGVAALLGSDRSGVLWILCFCY